MTKMTKWKWHSIHSLEWPRARITWRLFQNIKFFVYIIQSSPMWYPTSFISFYFISASTKSSDKIDAHEQPAKCSLHAISLNCSSFISSSSSSTSSTSTEYIEDDAVKASNGHSSFVISRKTVRLHKLIWSVRDCGSEYYVGPHIWRLAHTQRKIRFEPFAQKKKRKEKLKFWKLIHMCCVFVKRPVAMCIVCISSYATKE